MNQRCGLCGAPEGEQRPGRLGRYAVTCACCESARGSHLGDGAGHERRFALAQLAAARRTGLANRQPTAR